MAQDNTNKSIPRNEEITAGFYKLLDEHIQNLLAGKDERRFYASDFASRLFIHPRHFSNTIKLTTGVSPCDIVEERLIGEAKKLLKEPGLSVAEISARFAFTEATNFTKFFKGLTGITPRQYRQSIPADGSRF